jgi:aspartokinase-like uncharacterized kinase
MSWTIVKVGGSLFDMPNLRDKLRAWLAQFGDNPVLLVPGGGSAADAIRFLDQTHQLGEEASHWLAIQAMSLNAHFLHALLPDTRLVSALSDLASTARGWFVLDALPFFRADEARSDHLPHGWNVTSDSLAVCVATILQAGELILLKSVDWSGNDWVDASCNGIVDPYFPEAMRQTHPSLRVRIVNARTWT